MGAIANKPTFLTKVALQIFGGWSLLSPGHGRYGDVGQAERQECIGRDEQQLWEMTPGSVQTHISTTWSVLP